MGARTSLVAAVCLLGACTYCEDPSGCEEVSDGLHVPPDRPRGTGDTGTFPALSAAVSVAAGYYHSCATDTEGAVRCWGVTDTSDDSRGQVAQTPDTLGWVAVSAEAYMSCALNDLGEVWCWGSGFYGPTRLENPISGVAPHLVEVHAGDAFACGVREDRFAFCQGARTTGWIDVPDVAWSVLSTGWSASCGIDVSGQTHCWGQDDAGETQPPGDALTTVASGVDSACGLDTDGFPVCWGSDGNGQVSKTPAETGVAIDVGGFHHCMIRDDASLSCWGNNEAGQTRAPSGSFSQVALGVNHGCAIDLDGRVHCWGDNGHGQADSPWLP